MAVPPSCAGLLGRDDLEQSLVLDGQAAASKERPCSAAPRVIHIDPEDCRPWIEAARGFEMNSDFDLPVTAPHRPDLGQMDFATLLSALKSESDGKRTIQALGDKILLSQLLDNLGVPQMPLLFHTRNRGEQLQADVSEFFEANQEWDVVCKPVHLSNAQGVVLLSQEQRELISMPWLLGHVSKFMEQRADPSESAALRSLEPGFMVQPRYSSAMAFSSPVELRVTTVFGRARNAVWWWGRHAGPGELPHRNVWLSRKLRNAPAFSDDDEWEVMHNHPGGNEGFEEAVRALQHHMPRMAQIAEAVATAFGAPFLRSDFFVGSERWGVRLNEVAYGSGVDFRRRGKDDSSELAHILQEGLRCCDQLPPDHFLEPLGASGASYSELVHNPVKSLGPLRCWQPEDEMELVTVPPEGCRTPRNHPKMPTVMPAVSVVAGLQDHPNPSCPEKFPLVQVPKRRVCKKAVCSLGMKFFL